MNSLKDNIEYHLAYVDTADELEFDRIEDIHSNLYLEEKLSGRSISGLRKYWMIFRSG
jgi:hypothetical protein